MLDTDCQCCTLSLPLLFLWMTSFCWLSMCPAKTTWWLLIHEKPYVYVFERFEVKCVCTSAVPLSCARCIFAHPPGHPCWYGIYFCHKDGGRDDQMDAGHMWSCYSAGKCLAWQEEVCMHSGNVVQLEYVRNDAKNAVKISIILLHPHIAYRLARLHVIRSKCRHMQDSL